MPVPTGTSVIYWTEPGQMKQKPSSRSFRSLKTRYSIFYTAELGTVALPAQSQVRCDRGSRSSGTGWRYERTRRDALGWAQAELDPRTAKHSRGEREAREAERREEPHRKTSVQVPWGPLAAPS